MQAYAELIPPTAVTHSISLPFINAQSQELVIVKTSLLQVFQWRSIPSRVPSDPQKLTNGDANYLTSQLKKKLVLVGEYQMSGTVTSLAKIKAHGTKAGGDALLIAFLDAKVSLVEWNPEAHTISTISVHFYETEDLLGSPWVPEAANNHSYLTVDPSSRCAALKFGLRHLAIMPFRQMTDDLAMEDYDPVMDETAPASKLNALSLTAAETRAPYDASFVLQLTELDSKVVMVTDLAFLHEYREPTLGVLATSKSVSLGLASSRKDVLTYTVFTLDLDQRASTALISVTGLPSDLFRIVPLPVPIGGSLLIGGNELIHVDQAGKTHAVGINDFAKQASSFPMTDQSSLGLRLEGCQASHLGTGSSDVLLILSNGQLVDVKFRVDGRTVIGLSVKPVSPKRGGSIVGAAASSTATLGSDLIFLGSEVGDSLLLQCHGRRSVTSKKRSHAEMVGKRSDQSSDEDVGDDDEDDLYGDDVEQMKPQSPALAATWEETTYAIADRLPNLTCCGEPVLGKRKRQIVNSSSNSPPQLELAIATGGDGSGNITFLNRDLVFDQIDELDIKNAERIWTLNTATKEKSSLVGEANQTSQSVDSRPAIATTRFVIVSPSVGHDSSQIYESTLDGMRLKTDSDFESEVATMDAGMMCNGTRIVHVSPSEVRCYPLDLSFPQIYPVADEDSEDESKVKHSSLMDPYALFIRENGTCLFLKIDQKGELDELHIGKMVRETSWKSGCLWSQGGETAVTMAYLLGNDGNIHVFELPNLEEPIYRILNVGYLLPYFAPNTFTRRAANRDTIDEILVANLGGEDIQTPHLILRTSSDSLVVYRSFQYTSTSDGITNETTRWLKVADLPSSHLDTPEEEDEEGQEPEGKLPMRTITGFQGYRAAVFVHGPAPSVLLKEATSVPRRIRIRELSKIDLATYVSVTGAKSITMVGGEAAAKAETGSKAKLVQLPAETRYGDFGWAMRRVPQHQQTIALCYHPEQDLYVVCVNEDDNFQLPEDDDWHPDWSKEEITFRSSGFGGKVRLLDSKLSSIIAEVSVEPGEAIMCAKVIDLEVSEITHERRAMVVVGTALMRGEDQASNGAIYVYDVIRVVPDPDIPGSDRSLKLFVREEVKGAVTGVAGIGDDGFMLAAQGQKLMVRGLKEDCTLLPIAFLDVQTQVVALKNVRGTGLSLMADALKGVWLFGFATDPYRMRTFAKSRAEMESTAAELLIQGKQLFIVVTDIESNMHVLEFNPEDPKSLSGTRLLHRSAFHTGHLTTAMLPLPTLSTPDSQPTNNGDANMDEGEDAPPATQSNTILLTTQSGAIALVTPLDEALYRRLGALQNYLLNQLDHPCGLNPRSYRAVEGEGFGGRGVIDGTILAGWHGLSAQRKAEACARVGLDAWGVRRDLGVVTGAGVDYL